jgi:hypothetical protein
MREVAGSTPGLDFNICTSNREKLRETMYVACLVINAPKVYIPMIRHLAMY